MNALEIKGLSKSYGAFALKDLNLTVPGGCILGLIGENGAGKSTTIRLILDSLKRDAGTITILGRDNRDDPRTLKEDIGVVLDEVGIPECLTAAQTGKIMGRIFRRWQQDTYASLLKKLAIPADKPFKEFSRGMKMKLGIAVALSHEAKLLILDEATSGLDPVVRDEVVEMLSDFVCDEEHAILISSHIVSDLEKLCDYVAFLHKGELLLCEEKDALMEEYCIVRGSGEQIGALSPEAVISRRSYSFGAEAIVRRSAVGEELSVSPVSIEELFVHMVKEGKA